MYMASVTKKDGNGAMADEELERDNDEDRSEIQRSGGAPPKAPQKSGDSGPAFFTVYKHGQGYWTRMLTAGGALVVIGLTDNFLFRIALVGVAPKIKIAIVSVFTAAFALLSWWLMNKPQNADFLIATDSEMKKVNWTSQKELLGSTKVVIFFMFLMAAMLFITDVIFAQFFKFITVLKQGYF